MCRYWKWLLCRSLPQAACGGDFHSADADRGVAREGVVAGEDQRAGSQLGEADRSTSAASRVRQDIRDGETASRIGGVKTDGRPRGETCRAGAIGPAEIC
jgi:hypothetical protein